MSRFTYYVYIMFSHRNGTLYIGVTNNIVRRVNEHRAKKVPGAFTARYNCDKLGYYEEYGYINYALEREKQLKAGSRAKKISIIESINPQWNDLSLSPEFWLR